MKIMVCLKQVPHQDARLDIDANGTWIQEDNIKFEINSYDTYALEEALQLRPGDEEVQRRLDHASDELRKLEEEERRAAEATRLAADGTYDAVISVGALVRGGTAHFDLIAAEVAKGLAQASTSSGVPMSFGVITADTLEQAVERAGTKMGNKGWEAALAAIEMARLSEVLGGGK